MRMGSMVAAIAATMVASEGQAAQGLIAAADIYTPNGVVNVYDHLRGEPVKLPRDAVASANAAKAYAVDNSPVDDTGYGTGTASAGFGWLRASTSMEHEWFQVGGPSGAIAYSVATFADILTFDNGTPGSTGVANLALRITGNLREIYGFDSAVVAASGAAVSVTQQGGVLLGTRLNYYTEWAWQSGNEPLFLNQSLPITLRYWSGVPIEFQVSLRCSSGHYYGPHVASGFGSVETGCSAGHTLTWQGVQSALDADGNPLPVTVSSLSGANYARAIAAPGFATAVPEPSTWALLIGGFGLVGAAARRRRRLPV